VTKEEKGKRSFMDNESCSSSGDARHSPADNDDDVAMTEEAWDGPPTDRKRHPSSSPEDNSPTSCYVDSLPTNSSRAVCYRCHRPTPQACICEALPVERIHLQSTEVVILQHPLEIKQHKATANRTVPLLDLCFSKESLYLCAGRRLGDEIEAEVRKKLHDQPQLYQPVLVFPRLKADKSTGNSVEQETKILSLNDLIVKLKNERGNKDRDEDNPPTSDMSTLPSKKVLLLVLDATWKYAREMHLANKKYQQYPSHMLQVALEKEDLYMGDEHSNEFRPRRFEIRGIVSAKSGKRAAQEEDTTTTWMSTAECVAWIVSRLEQELGNSIATTTPSTTNEEVPTEHVAENQSVYQIVMKPLDSMVEKWKAYVTSPKNRKHDLLRGISKKNKREKNQSTS
jgi:DTW domain-containing protein YfiP